MSILIPGMKMPKDRAIIEIHPAGGYACTKYGFVIGRVIELPPHGDLIDRNYLEVVSYHNREGMEDTFDNGVKWMLEYIDKLTPVIPAEEE